MLRRLALRDFVIVHELEIEFDSGFILTVPPAGSAGCGAHNPGLRPR